MPSNRPPYRLPRDETYKANNRKYEDRRLPETARTVLTDGKGKPFRPDYRRGEVGRPSSRWESFPPYEDLPRRHRHSPRRGAGNASSTSSSSEPLPSREAAWIVPLPADPATREALRSDPKFRALSRRVEDGSVIVRAEDYAAFAKLLAGYGFWAPTEQRGKRGI